MLSEEVVSRLAGQIFGQSRSGQMLTDDVEFKARKGQKSSLMRTI